jgi:hypothetical protein
VGNDKGASVTYDGGRNFIMFDNMDVGQFYAVTADNRDPYWLYGGLQDSGNWGGPSNSRDYNAFLATTGSSSIQATASTPLSIPTTGASSIRKRRTAAFAGWMRRTASREDREPAAADHHETTDVQTREGAAPQFRYNWSSPLILSPHDSKVLYLGGNYLMRSADRGSHGRSSAQTSRRKILN